MHVFFESVTRNTRDTQISYRASNQTRNPILVHQNYMGFWVNIVHWALGNPMNEIEYVSMREPDYRCLYISLRASSLCACIFKFDTRI